MTLHGSQKEKAALLKENKSTLEFKMYSANVSNLMAISGRERKILSGPLLICSSVMLQWPECFTGMLSQPEVVKL